MESIFTRIINRELPAYIVDETKDFISILAREQIQPGHVLVIPKKPADKYTDMNTEDYLELHSYALRIAKILKKSYSNKQRIVLNIVGFEIPHLHIHLIPANNMEEVNKQGVVLTEEEMIQIQSTILEHNIQLL